MVSEDTTIELRERICTDRALTYYQSSINSLLRSLEYNDATKTYHTVITLDADDLEVLQKFAAEPPSNMHTWNMVSAILNGMYKGGVATNYQSHFQYNVGLETVIAVVLVYALYRLNAKQLSIFLVAVTSMLIAHFAHVRDRLSEEGRKLRICDVDKLSYVQYLKYQLGMEVNCEVDERFLKYSAVFQMQIREMVAFFEHIVNLIEFQESNYFSWALCNFLCPLIFL